MVYVNGLEMKREYELSPWMDMMTTTTTTIAMSRQKIVRRNGSKINKSAQCEHWAYTLHDFESTPQPCWTASTVLLRSTRQYFIYWYGLFGVIRGRRRRRQRCAETYLLDGWRFHVSKLCLVLVNLFPPVPSEPTSEIIQQQVHRCEMKKREIGKKRKLFVIRTFIGAEKW